MRRNRSRLTGAGELEEVLLLELLEHAALDLDELIGHEQGEDRVRVGVDGDIERDELVEEDEGMRNCRADQSR